MTIFAPAGYGKTTLLAQAAETDPRPFAWVSLERDDNDPIVLMTHLAEALARIVKVAPAVFDALRLPPTSLWSTTVPRLGATLAATVRPVVVVLDDVHVLRERDPLDIIVAISSYIPRGSQLMLAGRLAPKLRLARARAERRVADLDRDMLAFDAVEAEALLRSAGVDLTGPDVAELTRQTDGWAAALYLAALSLREGGTVDAVNGSRGYIADYIRQEVLSRMAPEQVEFLTRTAVLERMCGPLCDAVLEQTGSAAILESLERSNRLLVPLDNHGEWYRYHHLFRELLANELKHREPGQAAALNRRAAEWIEENGAPEAAIEYAFAGGDFARAARLVGVHLPEVWESGRLETARRWVKRIEESGLLGRYPAVAVIGAWGEGMVGEVADAERLAAIAEQGSSEEPLPDGSPTIEPWLASLRATLCRHGVEQMRADAERALELAPAWSFLRAVAASMLGVSFVLSGDDDRADAVLANAVDVATELDMHDEHSLALAERSLLAAARGDFDSAERLAQDAQRVVVDAGLDEYKTSAITYAALGRVALHRGELQRAQQQFVRADRLRPLLTHFGPSLSVQVRLELARARLALSDAAGARILLQEVDQLLRRVPALGVLVEQASELRDQAEAMRAVGGDWTPLLTEAELRVLPLLATHLTMAEIAQRQYVSRATVKTQAISIYRKLEVTKRGEAVERAVELGMIDSAAVPRSRDFDLSG